MDEVPGAAVSSDRLRYLVPLPVRLPTARANTFKNVRPQNAAAPCVVIGKLAEYRERGLPFQR